MKIIQLFRFNQRYYLPILTVAPIGNTKRVTRRSNFNVSSKHRNVTGNDAALNFQ